MSNEYFSSRDHYILNRAYIDHPNLKAIKKEILDLGKELPILCTVNDKKFDKLNLKHKYKYKLEHFLSYLSIPVIIIYKD